MWPLSIAAWHSPSPCSSDPPAPWRRMALFDEISARNPNWKKVYEDYARFRADQNLWFSIAEASLDQFTQAQRR